MLYIIANFKSNKTEEEARNWLLKFENYKIDDNKKIIICPPFTLLPFFKKFIKDKSLQFFLGAQNVSPFDEGPYTGEENAKQVKEFADFVLVGHSERRINFKEDENLLAKKCETAIKYDLSPIFMVQSEENNIPQNVRYVAYEPMFAIGSGTPDTPENAEKTAILIKGKGEYEVFYGGSVNSKNVNSFTSKQNISGVLVGGASLEAEEFAQIVQNA